MYQLFCDTNCELWHTTAKELGLRVIRMPYVLDGKEYYYDLGEATDFAHFYRRMREGAVPTTSAINEQDYIDYFEPVLQEGQDIYYITFSHKMSATFQSMDRAIAGLLQKYPGRQIRTFDTKSISLGAGFQVRYAAEKYRAGATMDELDAYLAELSAHTVVYFVVDDLVYLNRGGRNSALTATFGKLLNIKPLRAWARSRAQSASFRSSSASCANTTATCATTASKCCRQTAPTWATHSSRR